MNRPGFSSVVLGILLATIIIISCPGLLEAQENTGSITEREPQLVIDRISWDIEGRTREWVLRNLLELYEGMRFASEAELTAFLLDEQQTLINQRELHTSRIEYTIGEVDDPDGDQSVRVRIYVRDTWNIIALPYARYDSNEGLLLSIRARDYNFFGTLQDLRIDLDYEFTDEEENVFTISMDFGLPFEMLQREWALIFKQSLAFEEEELDFRLSLGLEHYFKWLGVDWTTGISEEYRYRTDDDDPDGYYLRNRFSLGSGITLPVSIPSLGGLRYSPEVNSSINYRPGGISRDRRGVTVGFDHSIAAGRFNWIGNYRDGRTLVIGNDNQYNITTGDWENDLYGRVSSFRALFQPDPDSWPRAGISSSLSTFYLIDGAPEDQDDAASSARGILNDRMNGDLGVFLNLDASFTLWTVRPIFEMQLGAFFDIAYVRDTRGDFYESTSFDRERDLKFGGGIAVIGFPLFARSLFVRGSYGVDLDVVRDGTSPLDSRAREIFIGLGHYY